MKHSMRIFITLSLLLIISSLLYLMIGSYRLSISDLGRIFINQGTHLEQFVVFNLRLPRLLIVIAAGTALSVSGSIIQSVTGNDLADPGIIGINAGAGLGVTLFFLQFGFTASSFAFLLPIVAFGSGLLTAAIIFLLSNQKHQGINPSKMILIGIGFSMAFSGLMVILISSADRSNVAFIASWLSGNIWGGNWRYVNVITPLIVGAFIVTYRLSNTINVIQLGSDTATGLGVTLKKMHIILLMLATLLASLAVSVVGNIAFLGLVAPHIAKQLIGRKNQVSLPMTALIGSLTLVIADLLAKNLIEPNGIPTGIVISIIGAPYFIYLLIKQTNPV